MVLAVCCFWYAYKIMQSEKQQYQDTCKNYKELFQDKKEKVPKETLSIKEITKVEKKVKNIAYPKEKAKLEKELKELKKYVNLRDKINKNFTLDILNSNVTMEVIEEATEELTKLKKKYQKLLSPKVDEINIQLSQITTAKQAVQVLFMDDTFQIVKEEATRDLYNNAVLQLQTLKQQDIVSEYQGYLNKVEVELVKREEEEKRRQIQAAWTILKVPYISQNKNNVLNGCEVAYLLMGLQYKGYLKDMDLVTYATNVPKSDNPFTGFTYDIFGLQPNNVPHWIAPEPLAAYGRNTAGTAGVIDATGSSLSALDSEIQKGNPVIIWLTSKLKAPKETIENAPKNLHVLLLTGYNSITKEHIITDPWTHDDGRTSWQVSKLVVENIYNATGQRAVIISG